MPTAAAAFPRHPDEVTPGWLTERLRSTGSIGLQDSVVGFTPSPVGVGNGVLGELVRLRLEFERGGGPVRSVVVKCATRSDANRAIAVTLGLYQREVRFYRDLATTMGDRVPACHAAAIDGTSSEFVLLLEDLDGYRPGDQAAGCDIADAERCLEVMATLHAAWWELDVASALGSWPSVDSAPHRDGLVAATAASYESFSSNFGHLLPAEVRAAGPRFIEGVDALHARMGEGSQTLVHGDFRLDNVLFGQSQGQRPIVVLDWQAVLVSKPMHDVAYLLTQSLSVDLRRTNERRLVARYHDDLVNLGIDGYTLQEAWDDYCLASLWLYEYVIVTGAMEPANARGTAFMAAMTERCGWALADLGLMELLP